MKVIQTAISGVVVFEPDVFGDERGHFSVSFNKKAFEDATGESVEFVQDNESRSSRGVLRGLHCQLPPHAQGKLVRVSRGCVLDVAVDLRPNSPTLGHWVAQELSDENHRQLWIPPGMAHGFLVLSDIADLQYKVTGDYAPAADRSIRWDDPDLAIAWPDIGMAPLLSPKDAAGLTASAVLAETRAALAAI
jgi:dTDP-4-dehydrorhamnose 3,5-epimerase